MIKVSLNFVKSRFGALIIATLVAILSPSMGYSTPDILKEATGQEKLALLDKGFVQRGSGQLAVVLTEIPPERQQNMFRLVTEPKEYYSILFHLLNEGYPGLGIITLRTALLKIHSIWLQSRPPLTFAEALAQTADFIFQKSGRVQPSIAAYNSYFALKNIIGLLAKEPSIENRNRLIRIRAQLKVLAQNTPEIHDAFRTKEDGRAWNNSAWLELDDLAEVALQRPSMEVSPLIDLKLSALTCVHALKHHILGHP